VATYLERLLEAGDLHRLAAEHGTVAGLAKAIGMSAETFSRKCRQLRAQSVPMPTFPELAAGRRDIDTVIEKSMDAPGPRHDAHIGDRSDFAEEEPTNPSARGVTERTVDHDIAERRAKAESSSLKVRLRDALDKLEQCQYELGIAIDARAARHDVDPIRPRETASGQREATAVALASDWHIGEVVHEGAVNGVNKYDLEIAKRRCERYFAGVSYLTNYHREHFLIRDMVLWLGGDLITGYLREEDLESNSLSPVQEVATLHKWLASGIRSILTATPLESMRVVCNSGNHGRLTKKIQPRTREANSLEWLLYHMLASEFADEPRVQFVLPLGLHTYVEIYDWVLRFTHGDSTKGGGGVGGIMIPIRKAMAKWQTVRRAHATVMGHWHQEHFLSDLIINGSLIGYNEFALEIAAPFEHPRQGFFLVDRHRGISMTTSNWVADREAA